jgi:16S rRNA (uracil1498-N3)-methyltransferase
MRRRFFVDAFQGSTAALFGEAAHHLARVLRATPGQLYELSDGTSLWLARIERVSRNAVDFALVEQLPAHPPKLHTTLLLAIVKFDRFEWALEKATELGVSEIIPLSAARSEKALVARAAKRALRWQKILLESAQQSRRLCPPLLRSAVRPAQVFAEVGARHVVPLLLSELPNAPSIHGVLAAKKTSSAALAVGPEGGWTDDELAAARSAGFLEASLGANILRTETAVAAGLAILNFALGE